MLFLALSVFLIPYAGIQEDEALFTTPLYLHIGNEFRVRILHHDVYMMVISYIGALKTALFVPIFSLFGANAWSLRLPVVLLGAGTVFVFYFIAEQSAGRWAALLAALLLATDPVFLLTNTFDWGPVAVEHILLVTGVFCVARANRSEGTMASRPISPHGPLPGGLLRLARSGSERKYLILGFLCFGLALWDKAVFVWALAGLTAAGLLVFWPELSKMATRSNLRTAAAAFLVGILPLVVYNVRHKSATLRENAHFDPRGPIHKWTQLENALNGSSLFGYMVSEEWRPNPKPAATCIGRASVWLRDRLGERRSTGLYYVFSLLVIAVPLWWTLRAARFSLVFMTVTWLAMALTRDAGGAAHHVVLLWPFPILFLATGVGRAFRAHRRVWRLLAAYAAAALIAMNLVVLNQYVAQFERYGPSETFTDGIYPLSDDLTAFAGRPVYVIDWGMANPLAFLHQGRLNLKFGSGPLMDDSPSEAQQKAVRAMIANPGAVFVAHIAGEEMFPMVNERLDRVAASLGFRKELLQTAADSNGRPRFEVFQFVPGADPGAPRGSGTRPTDSPTP